MVFSPCFNLTISLSTHKEGLSSSSSSRELESYRLQKINWVVKELLSLLGCIEKGVLDFNDKRNCI